MYICFEALLYCMYLHYRQMDIVEVLRNHERKNGNARRVIRQYGMAPNEYLNEYLNDIDEVKLFQLPFH